MKMQITKQQIVDTIAGGIQVISDPNRWCCGELARKENGDLAFPESPDAAKFCAIGSMFYVNKGISGNCHVVDGWTIANETWDWADSRMEELYQEGKVSYPSIPGMNDDAPHEEVIRTMNLLLEEAKNLPDDFAISVA